MTDQKQTRLFVGSIKTQISQEEFKQNFTTFGPVTDVWISKKLPGFGFIEFQNEENARACMWELNGAFLFGGRIRVEVIKQQQSRKRERGQMHGCGMHKEDKESRYNYSQSDPSRGYDFFHQNTFRNRYTDHNPEFSWERAAPGNYSQLYSNDYPLYSHLEAPMYRSRSPITRKIPASKYYLSPKESSLREMRLHSHSPVVREYATDTNKSYSPVREHVPRIRDYSSFLREYPCSVALNIKQGQHLGEQDVHRYNDNPPSSSQL